MAQATGIHVGRSRITAVTLRGSSKSPTVAGVGSCPRPEDPEALGAAVRALCAERGLPRDPSVLALPNDAALMRTIALPFTNPDQIRKVLKGEAEAALAGLSVEEMALGSHFLGASENEGRVMAVAMRKATLGPMLKGLAASGVDPFAVDLEGFAVANALVGLGHVPETGAVIAIEADPDEARFTLLSDRRVRVVRSVPMPLAVPEVPVDATDPPDASGELPPDPADLADRPLVVNAECIADFEAEITRTLVAGGLMDPPTRVLLCGTLAADPALAAAAERVMGVGAEVLNPLEDLGAPGPDALAATAALGAAWKGIGFDHDEVNLRVDDLAFKRRFDQVAGALATFVTLAFLVLLVLLIDTKQRHADLRREWTLKVLRPAFARFTETLNKVETDAAKRDTLINALKNETTTPREKVMGRMVSQLRKWRTKLQGGAGKADFQMVSALDRWRDWSDRLLGFQPRPKYWVLDQLEIDLKPPPSQGRIFCKGWVDVDTGRAAIENMKNSVASLADFADTVPGVTTAGVGPDGEQRLSFSLATTLPLEATGKPGDAEKSGGSDG